MRYNKKYIKARFETFADQFGLKVVGRDTSHGKPGYVGAVLLDYAACYGGYSIRQIANECGGQNELTKWGRRLKAAELIAWFDGAEWVWQNRVVTVGK